MWGCMLDELHLASQSDGRIPCGGVRDDIGAINLFPKEAIRIHIRCRQVLKQPEKLLLVHSRQNNGRSVRTSLSRAGHGPLLPESSNFPSAVVDDKRVYLTIRCNENAGLSVHEIVALFREKLDRSPISGKSLNLVRVSGA